MCFYHQQSINWILAQDSAQRILKAQNIFVAKVDPLNDDDFVALSERFTRRLLEQSRPIDEIAVQRAIQALDVPWDSIAQEEQLKIINQAAAFLNVGTAVASATISTVAENTEVIVDETANSVSKEIGVAAVTGFSRQNPKIAASMIQSHTGFVTGEYNRHAVGFSQRAQSIVLESIDAGLSNGEITQRISDSARTTGLSRTEHYWRVTAYAIANRARTYTQLDNYSRAGIQRYQCMAVLDNRTTDFCRYVDGKTFVVNDSLASYDQVAESEHYDSVKDYQPWVQRRKNEDGSWRLFVTQRDGTEITVATVERSEMGKSSRIGSFRGGLGADDLTALGLGQPPYHALCRTIAVPIT